MSKVYAPPPPRVNPERFPLTWMLLVYLDRGTAKWLRNIAIMELVRARAGIPSIDD